MRHLHLFTFASQIDFLQEIQSFSTDVEVIECGQKHRSHFVLLFYSAQKLTPSARVQEHFVSTQSSENLLRAYFKQTPPPPLQSLCLLEGPSLCHLLQEIDGSSQLNSAALVEISRGLGTDGLANAVFYGLPQSPQLKNSAIRVGWFPSPNSHLRNLF